MPGSSNILHLENIRGYHDGFCSKVITLIDSTIELQFVSSVDCEAIDLYMQFWRLLENINIMDWPFLFWDSANHCTINPKPKQVNKVWTDVFVIANKESGGLGYERRWHNNGGFSSKSYKEIFPLLSMQPSDPNSCNNDVVLVDPLDSSWVSGSTSEADFQPLLLTKDVVKMYFLAEKKLRLDLKNTYQDDQT